MSPDTAYLFDADRPVIEIDDPIDVCSSRNRRAIVLFGDEPGRRRVRGLLAEVHSVSCPPGNNFFAFLGRVTARRAGARIPVGRFLEIRNEDLLLRPGQTVTALLDFLGESSAEFTLRGVGAPPAGGDAEADDASR